MIGSELMAVNEYVESNSLSRSFSSYYKPSSRSMFNCSNHPREAKICLELFEDPQAENKIESQLYSLAGNGLWSLEDFSTSHSQGE